MGCWLGLRALKTLYFYFCKVIKKIKKVNWKDFCKEFCKKLWKNIILGTSDAWSMRRSSHQPINPATHHIILKIVRFKLSNAKQALDDKNWLNWNTVSRVCPLSCPELWRRDQTQSLCFQRPDRLHRVRFFIPNPIASRSTSLLVAHQIHVFSDCLWRRNLMLMYCDLLPKIEIRQSSI